MRVIAGSARRTPLKTIEGMSTRPTTDPVSYTHLDVYKRQFLIRLPMSYLMSIRPNASLTGIGLAAPTATDVYKRQASTAWETRQRRA